MASASATVMSASTQSVRERGMSACPAVWVGKSSIRSSSPLSSGESSPVSPDSATMCSRSRAVAECSRSCTGSMPTARSSASDARSNSPMSQPNTERYQVVERASQRETGSGRAMARFLGTSSPKSICTTVDSSRASTVPMVRPIPVGTCARPSASPRALPMSGSAT